jgi:predicted nucleic acid-binding protein
VTTAYFLDSSALVKRYVQEDGTRWVRNLTRRDAPNLIYLARITVVEVTAAVARRRGRGKSLTARQASSILHRFRQHVAGRYLVVEVTPALLTEAVALANSHALRAYDAVQLALAIQVHGLYRAAGGGSVVLVSADQELNDAALAEGLAVEDPRSHP